LRDLAPIVDWNDDQCGLDPRLILFTASTGRAMTVLDTNVVGIVLQRLRAISARVSPRSNGSSVPMSCASRPCYIPPGRSSTASGDGGVFDRGSASLPLLHHSSVAPSARALYLARAFQGVGAAFLLARRLIAWLGQQIGLLAQTANWIGISALCCRHRPPPELHVISQGGIQRVELFDLPSSSVHAQKTPPINVLPWYN
jgi:hypothetical protein